jgi:hypothetical protein
MTTPTRRWFQFSLRSLLLLMLLVATYFAGFVTSQKLAEKGRREAEEKAAAELAAAKAAAEQEMVLQLKGFKYSTITTGPPVVTLGIDTGIAASPPTEYRYPDPLAPQGPTGP